MPGIKQLSYQRLGIYYLSHSQQLLIKAAVLPGVAGVDAWEEWQSLVDLENLDSASNALLCQLYCNLTKNQVQHPHLAKLKGIYKRSWYGNQLQRRKLQKVITALNSHQLAVAILDEVALMEQYELDRGSRSLDRVNLLIHPEQLESAIAILSQLGWQLTSERKNRTDLWLEFADQAHTRLYLWGNLFNDAPFPAVHTAQQLWKDTVLCDLGGVGGTASLNSSNALLRLSTRIFQRGCHSSLVALADALILCQSESIDWIDVIAKAQCYGCILPLRNLLLLLGQLCSLKVPPWVISALYQIPMSSGELVKYQILPTDRKTLLKSWFARSLDLMKST